jgi:parallel beta-helix repeat protein
MNSVGAYGATYFVAKTGSNSNSCAQARSMSTSKLTIAGGLACMTGGDFLVIRAGIYDEYITYNQVVSGKSDSNRTIIKAYPGEVVTLRPTGGTRDARGNLLGDVIWIHGKRYITIDGLTVDAINAARSPFFANDQGSTWPSFITLHNSVFMNSRRSNCVTVQPGNDFHILNNKIYNCGHSNLEHGIYLRGSRHLIEHNEIYNISGYGIHLYSQSVNSDDNIVRYNNIHDNGEWGILIGSGSSNIAHGNIVKSNGKKSSAGGIDIGHFSTRNNQAYKNVISGNTGICVHIRPTSKDAKVYDNECSKNGSDSVIDRGAGSLVGKSPP